MTKRIRSVAMIFNHQRFGNDILAYRLEHGMTQTSIATLTGISTTAISQYEQALEPRMSVGNLIAMCNVYDLDPREYFELER